MDPSRSPPRGQQTEEVRIEMAPYKTSEPRPQEGPNLPDNRLLDDQESYEGICIPLYDASIRGNWEGAEKIIHQYGLDVTGCSITGNCETALHIAAGVKGKNLEYVTNLVKIMSHEALKFQTQSGNTALCLAAAAGNVGIADILVTHNKDLLNIPGSGGMLPLNIASLCERYETVKYLYGESNKLDDRHWTYQNRDRFLLSCVKAEFYDIAGEIVKDLPELSLSYDVLEVLARKPEAFRTSSQFSGNEIAVNGKESHATELLRAICTYVKKKRMNIDDIIRRPRENEEVTTSHVQPEKRSSPLLFIAAEMGNTKFITEVFQVFPRSMWNVNDFNHSIFHVAILHRQEGIYNLKRELEMDTLITFVTDKDGNNMLHLAAMNVKNKRLHEISGVALQMQREALWYEEIKAMLPISAQEQQNNDGLLPHELFIKEHQDLISASEKWMRDTASQCMVVSALITTMVFTAAFTVPGGYNQDFGIPVLLYDRAYIKNKALIKNKNFIINKAFIIFVISDAVSLASATCSILMFLYILTSRYDVQDYLETLPKKLMGGLAALFLSITAMMVAFSASFFALYDENLIWVPNVISAFASVPIIMYAKHQYGLLAAVYRSTYGSKNLFKPKKPEFY